MKFATRIKPNPIGVTTFLLFLVSPFVFQYSLAEAKEVALKCTFPLWKYRQAEGVPIQTTDMVSTLLAKAQQRILEKILVIDVEKTKYNVGRTSYDIYNDKIIVSEIFGEKFEMVPGDGIPAAWYWIYEIDISRIDLTSEATFLVYFSCRHDSLTNCKYRGVARVKGHCVRVPKLL